MPREASGLPPNLATSGKNRARFGGFSIFPRLDGGYKQPLTRAISPTLQRPAHTLFHVACVTN